MGQNVLRTLISLSFYTLGPQIVEFEGWSVGPARPTTLDPPPEAGALRAPGCAQSATTPAVRVGKLFLYNRYALLEDALTHATATI